MLRRLILPAAGVLAALALTGCTGAPVPDATPTAAPPADGGSGSAGTGILPSCEDVGAALGSLIDGLPYDEAGSAPSTQEAYEQRVCVFGPADGRIGVTIAAIPFLETELQAYGESPNAIDDPRTQQRGAVLQTLQADDGADGHLDSALYLFDLEYSVTIQQSGATVLAQLTVPAASDAAFAVRELIV